MSNKKIFNNQVYEQHIVDRYSTTFYLSQGQTDDMNIRRNTDKAQWVLQHGKNIEHQTHQRFDIFETEHVVTAYITPKRWTEFLLKFA